MNTCLIMAKRPGTASWICVVVMSIFLGTGQYFHSLINYNVCTAFYKSNNCYAEIKSTLDNGMMAVNAKLCKNAKRTKENYISLLYIGNVLFVCNGK